MSDDVLMDNVLGVVRRELVIARRRFAPFHSPHEGLAVILEEYRELEREVFERDGRAPAALEEAVQLSAMGARYVLEMDGRR